MREATRTSHALSLPKALTIATAIAGAIALAGCGGSAGTAASGTSAPAATVVDDDFNDADITFARDMIPHHQQAVVMSELAADRTSNADILALATEINAAQAPEIETMTGFLDAWGADAASPTAMEMSGDDMAGDDMAGMDHGGPEGMEGMATDDELSALEGATDDEFDSFFLTLMIDHHRGAIAMAQVELDAGVNQQARELAADIIAGQQAELSTMEGLLSTAGS